MVMPMSDPCYVSKKFGKLILLILTALFIIGTFILFTQRKSAVRINGATYSIEVADSPEKQYKGLSNRPSICSDCGMLFVFKDRSPRTFVMREMEFPLDIVWIDGVRVVGAAKDLPPEGKNYSKRYDSGEDVDRVLELNAGTVERDNINIGDNVVVENL